MADMVTGNFSNLVCSDCGEMGCEFTYRGNLAPKGEIGFCLFCCIERQNSYYRGEWPKPLGVKPPGIPEEFLAKVLRVTTKSGSVYVLDLAEDPQERIISCRRYDLSVRARILRLALNESFAFRFIPAANQYIWLTSPVMLIEELGF